ncbi:MAG TPA: VOC family protein [Terriglobia bacterium]|nr:VOC family protein [Terriglobia bacterium]
MDNFYARTVFFVKDAEAALAFYTKTLGFALDWNYQYEGRAWVFEVSLFGFEIILNQAYKDTEGRPGHGRVFIGLEDHQAAALCNHVREKGIEILHDEWGKPTLVIKDLDGNELFFWLPESELAKLESEIAERTGKPIPAL